MKKITHGCIVIGTGAAGYNAACRLKEAGVDVGMITEGITCGTSRNTGSDKQTYYKLGLGGSAPDSVRAMAEDLFAGGSVDGDNALCEAALSARCFLRLCELGVAFPHNRYGEYVGYKTDHDPYARATSAGPLTSKFMTEALEEEAKRLGIPVYDRCLATRILTCEGRVCGVLCLGEDEEIAVRCGDVILATGGPAGIYADSVYPQCHTGSTGLALAAGAKGQNLSLWQYGLASLNPRWNVSGTYMQVLPRFLSVDAEGNEREFLADYYDDPYQALSTVFLKGYQWPFDPKKATDGSSVIDRLVDRERVEKGRRVYLDYTKNPFGLEQIEYERLSPEAYDYLRRANATFGTPIRRLEAMNAPAIELYRSKGVDLTREPLEIALCAQHNNGGIAVDLWWQTSVGGLFAVGECAGTHGIARPGGSALNAGQVGSLRAAQIIAHRPSPLPKEEDFASVLSEALAQPCFSIPDGETRLAAARRRMSDCAAALRDREGMERLLRASAAALEEMKGRPAGKTEAKLRDATLTQIAVLSAMLDGVPDPASVQETVVRDGVPVTCRRPVRPLPEDGDFFELVWRDYRTKKYME